MVATRSIVHIVPSIANEASGPSYSVVRLCESLIEEGQNVTLATLDWVPTSSSSSPDLLQRFPLGIGPRRLGRSPAMKEWLKKQASSDSIEILHNHSLWMMPNVYPGKVARNHNIPLVISPRGTLSEWAMSSGSKIKSLFWPFLQKPVLDSTTCFHATAYSEYEDIRRLGFKQPVVIIPNGIDIPSQKYQETLTNAKEYRTLLFLGRIHPIKGVDILLKAWDAISPRFPDWRLQIVGPDNSGYLPQMQLLASQLGLERVEFSGPLLGNEKVKAYQKADLFVLPTHSENFGVTVAESLAVGTPAIVSKGAPWEGLKTRLAGWWIDLGVDPLVACLEEALSSSNETLSVMGKNGQEWMIEEYSWDEIARKLDRAYRWILGDGRKPDWVIEE